MQELHTPFHSSYTENCHLLCFVQFVLLTVHRQDAWGCCIFCIWPWSIDMRDGGPSSDIPTEKKYFSFCWNWQYSLSCIPKVSIRCNSLEIFQVWEGAFPFICRSLISWMCTYKTVLRALCALTGVPHSFRMSLMDLSNMTGETNQGVFFSAGI